MNTPTIVAVSVELDEATNRDVSRHVSDHVRKSAGKYYLVRPVWSGGGVSRCLGTGTIVHKRNLARFVKDVMTGLVWVRPEVHYNTIGNPFVWATFTWKK